MDEHRLVAVIFGGAPPGRYVCRCSCGWRSDESPHARSVRSGWETHVFEAITARLDIPA